MIAEFMEDFFECDTILNDYGFMAYKMDNGICCIMHLFVRRDFRKSGETDVLFDSLLATCRENEIEKVRCSVDLCLEGATDRIKVIIKRGFKTFCNMEQIIVFERGV